MRLNFATYYKNKLKTNSLKTSMLPEPHKLTLAAIEDPLIIAIDPGTSSFGVAIGLADKKIPIGAFLITKEEGEADPKDFENNVCILFESFIKTAKIKEVIIESQFFGKYKNSTQVLKAFTKTITRLFEKSNIKVHSVAPQSWKKTFLADFKEMGYKMNQSNKNLVGARAREFFPPIVTTKMKDASDALGILHYYYVSLFSNSGLVKVVKSSNVSLTSSIYMAVSKVPKDMDKELEMWVESGKPMKREVKFFEYNNELSCERNIREVTNTSRDIFISVTEPTIALLKELIPRREYIGPLEPSTKLIVVGYRQNIPKGGS